VSGSGSGHHVGLSQWGANGMAKAGFDYQQIVKFYFTGVQVGPAA
jgi:stage II sporulation protein D